MLILMYVLIAVTIVTGLSIHRYQNSLHLTPRSKWLLKRYKALPAEHQGRDLSRILAALEVKYTKEKIEKHFRKVNDLYDRKRSQHMNRCTGNRCQFKEYAEIESSIAAIEEQVIRQKRILEVSRVSGTLEETKELIQELKTEAKFAKEANDYVEHHR